MACSKYILTNTGSTIVTFNYRRCDDGMWEYQVELEPNQTKNIWLVNSTYSSANITIVVDNQGAFPPAGATPTPTPTPTNTPTNTMTPTQTASQTPTPTDTPSVTSTPTNTATQTPTQTQTGTPNVTSTPTDTPASTSTPTPTMTQTPEVTSTPTETAEPTVTPTPTMTQTPEVTSTPTPTITRFSFTVGSGSTANEACEDTANKTIWGNAPLFDNCTQFYLGSEGPTGMIAGFYASSTGVVTEIDSDGLQVGAFSACVVVPTPTPTATSEPTSTPHQL